MNSYKPHILNLVEICVRKNITNFILSPGSRNSPLTLALLRHPDIKCYTVTDERSAAFIALGMAQQLQNPVGIVCTSGTATLNYAPAITEAFYQKIPLLILTADRPPEWIDQFDNQSIRQFGIYKENCLGSFQLPVEPEHEDAKWHSDRVVSEAINLTTYPVRGPVHINIPLREPLYPKNNQEFNYNQNVKVIDIVNSERTINDDNFSELINIWNKSEKILILAGMNNCDNLLSDILSKFKDSKNIVIISDITSNIDSESIMYHSDIILSNKSEQIKLLAPDLIITFGGAIVSKATKSFIKKYKPKEHWHIQEAGLIGDTFQSLTKIIPVNPRYFFNRVLEKQIINLTSEYINCWAKIELKAKKILKEFLNNQELNEFSAIYKILPLLPENSLLQLGNSMPIRYANYISADILKNNIQVNANRGTSGIDGTVSTSLGACLVSNKLTTIIVGDLAFFYDHNALWNNYIPANLRIIVMNNHGGGIFRILEGSGSLSELDKYFETENKLNAENTARDFNLDYFICNNYQDLDQSLKAFFSHSDKAKILEIETNSTFNTEVFNNFKLLISNLELQ